MHDPRAIANMILEEGHRLGRPVSNVALQKLLYFAHGLFLIEHKAPLVDGFFEAWQYGPVHPTVYHCFKSAGDQPISFRAVSVDALTGERKLIPSPSLPEITEVITRVMLQFGRLTPGRLIDLSHAKRAPWHFVVENSRNTMSLGLRIPNDVILERFRFHIVSVSEAPKSGEPGDDYPILARD